VIQERALEGRHGSFHAPVSSELVIASDSDVGIRPAIASATTESLANRPADDCSAANAFVVGHAASRTIAIHEEAPVRKPIDD
jgi:hypothetical protein